MKQIIIVSLFVLVSIIQINFAAGEENQQSYSVYKNEEYGFAIEYPSDWYFVDIDAIWYFEIDTNTSMVLSKFTDDFEFKNLQDQEYLDKMIKEEQVRCNDNESNSMGEFGFTCSNFEYVFSTVVPDPDNKYPAYTIGHTYTINYINDGTITDKSIIVLQIPDRDNTWIITVTSTNDELPNHLEEIASTLNSFTILDYVEPKSICVTGTIEKDGICIVDTTKTTEEKSSEGGGCLIATATYGSELAPQVQQLRELRDNSLLQTASGTSFMSIFNQFYYTFSPTIADWERESPVFKELVKLTLTPMISSLSILNYVNMDSEESVLGYGISLILLNVGMYFVAPIVMIHTIRKRF